MTVFKLFVLYCKFFLVCYMACYVFFVILLLISIKFVLLIVASSISLNIRVVSLYYFLCESGFSVGYCRRLRHNWTFLVKVLSYVLVVSTTSVAFLFVAVLWILWKSIHYWYLVLCIEIRYILSSFSIFIIWVGVIYAWISCC